MRRRLFVVVVSGLVAVLSVAIGGRPASAAGALDVTSNRVAAGGVLRFTVTGCPHSEQGAHAQNSRVLLVSGTSPQETLLGYPTLADDSGAERYVLRVPLWADPDAPARLVGECVRTEANGPDPEEPVSTVAFTFPDVPIDITPKTSSASGPVFRPDRTTAEGGQVIMEAASGCEPNDYASVQLIEGGDLSGRTEGDIVRADIAPTDGRGTAKIEVALVTDPGTPGGGALPEGTYTARGGCGDDLDPAGVWAEMHVITVSGTNPSDAFDLQIKGDRLVASGAGCADGEQVSVALTDVFTLRPLANLAAVPGADGTWYATLAEPRGSYFLEALADCGDPMGDGFRYVTRSLSGGVDPDTTSAPESTPEPTSAPPAESLPGAASFTG